MSVNAEYDKRLKKYKEKQNVKNCNDIICVVFDGVIHSFVSEYTTPETIPDNPVDGAFDWLVKHLPDPDNPELYSGPVAQILSSRSRTYRGIAAMKDWFILHGFPCAYFEKDILKFPKEKPRSIITIDVKSVQFSGVFPDDDFINNFLPWKQKRI